MMIYDVIDDAKKILGGLLAPEQREKFLGYADIREVFAISRTGKVAGCYVTEAKSSGEHRCGFCVMMW